MLVLIGLVANGSRDLAAVGPTARTCLLLTVIVMAAAIVLLAVALTRKTIDMKQSDYARQVGKANARILNWIRVGTVCLALGVLLTTVALVSAFSSPSSPKLGSDAAPVHVKTTK